MKAQERIIVALDFDSWDEAIALVMKLRGEVGMFKIGKELFTAEGRGLVREIVGMGQKVFLDLKYHDIPTTVAKACVAAVRLGVSIMNVHANAEMPKAMLEASNAVAKVCREEVRPRPHILGVTVLTSADGGDMAEEVREDLLPLEKLVLHRAKLARDCRLDGVVASPQEARILREAMGRQFLIATPGVRSKGASVNDQKRVATPGEAVRDGANYLVIGRQLTGSKDPIEEARAIAREIETATN